MLEEAEKCPDIFKYQRDILKEAQFGEFGSQAFFHFSVLTGKLKNTSFGTFARIAKSSATFDGLIDIDERLDDDVKRDALLQSLAWYKRDSTLLETEDVLCKIFRENDEFDLFAFGQRLYKIQDNIVFCKFWGENVWKPRN